MRILQVARSPARPLFSPQLVFSNGHPGFHCFLVQSSRFSIFRRTGAANNPEISTFPLPSFFGS